MSFWITNDHLCYGVDEQCVLDLSNLFIIVLIYDILVYSKNESDRVRCLKIILHMLKEEK